MSKSKKHTGSLIAFEGTDASGKSVQSKLLVQCLKDQGNCVEYFDFPRYESIPGHQIAKFLRGELGSIDDVSAHEVARLFAADRAEVAQKIKDSLDAGCTVVCNRYTPSSAAHQGAKIKGDKQQDQFVKWVEDLEHIELSIPHESCVIYLDMPYEKSSQLQKHREKPLYLEGDADIQEADTEYQQKVRTLYNKLASTQKNWITISCVDKDDALYTPDIIHNEVLKALKISGRVQ